MKIVVLDGFTLNPGDLSWAKLESLGPSTIYDRTPGSQVVERSCEAEILLTNKVELSREHFSALPLLKYVGVTATGTNIVDLQAARERGITVTNVPAYGTSSVAQTAIALLMELTQHIGQHSRAVREGRWSSNPDWSFWEKPLIELDGLTMGIVGLGRIGTAVATLASAFGMKVISATGKAKVAPAFVQVVDLKTLFQTADVISLHCPLTPETKQLVNAERLGLMKPTAFLLNTSRGGLIDEQALADALNSGRIAGAGLDVLSAEPPPTGNPLLAAKNCIITPHFAWATRAARTRLMDVAVHNVQAFLSGKPINVVVS